MTKRNGIWEGFESDEHEAEQMQRLKAYYSSAVIRFNREVRRPGFTWVRGENLVVNISVRPLQPILDGSGFDYCGDWVPEGSYSLEAVFMPLLPCEMCGDSYGVDSGGFTPWGYPINLPCPLCCPSHDVAHHEAHDDEVSP